MALKIWRVLIMSGDTEIGSERGDQLESRPNTSVRSSKAHLPKLNFGSGISSQRRITRLELDGR